MEAMFENVEIEGDSCFKTWRFQCPSLESDHGWHYHPEFELTYVIKSEGMRFVGDSIQHFEEGDLVLVGANLPHCWQNDDVGSEDQEHCDLVVAQFSRSSFGEYFLGLPENRAISSMLERANRGLVIGGSAGEAVKQILLSLDGQQKGMRLVKLLECLQYIAESNELEELASAAYTIEKDEFHGRRISKIVRYVRDHLSEDIKQPILADIVGLTPQGFSRFFRAATGQTFVSFVNTVRITEACRQLVNSDKDITIIAYDCGYANLSNFNRRFREMKEVTPSKYRKLHSRLAVNPA